MNKMTESASKPVNEAGETLDVGRLVEAAKGGDAGAFGELVKGYHVRVHGLLMGIVHNEDDARDLAQVAWVKAWKKLDTFKGAADFYTWLYRLVTFAGLDFLRKRKRQRETSLDERDEWIGDAETTTAPSVISRPDRAVQASEIESMFKEALVGLSPDQRTALVLREVEGLSYDEIAKVMKCRRGTVMSRIFYARKSIQEKLKELR